MQEKVYAKGNINLQNGTIIAADCLFSFDPSKWTNEECILTIQLERDETYSIFSENKFLIFNSFSGIDENKKEIFIRGLVSPEETISFDKPTLIIRGIPEIIYQGDQETLICNDFPFAFDFYINQTPFVLESNKDFITKFDGTINKSKKSNKNIIFKYEEIDWRIEKEYSFEENLHSTEEELLRTTTFKISGERKVIGKGPVFNYLEYYFLKIPNILLFLSFLSRNLISFNAFKACIKSEERNYEIYGKKFNPNQIPESRQRSIDCILIPGRLTSIQFEECLLRFIGKISNKNFFQMVSSNISSYNSRNLVDRLDNAYRALESLQQLHEMKDGGILERNEFAKLKKSLSDLIEKRGYSEEIKKNLLISLGNINQKKYGKTPVVVKEIISKHHIDETLLLPKSIDLLEYLYDFYLRRNDFIHENTITPYANFDCGFINRLIELFLLSELKIDKEVINNYRFESEIRNMETVFAE